MYAEVIVDSNFLSSAYRSMLYTTISLKRADTKPSSGHRDLYVKLHPLLAAMRCIPYLKIYDGVIVSSTPVAPWSCQETKTLSMTF